MSIKTTTPLTFFTPENLNTLGAVYFDTGISAGFPSPAEDFKQERLSLDSELIKNKEATFFARVSGQSMIDAGLNDNDLLVIDRSLSPTHNKIAVCFLDGEFTVKRLKVEKNKVWLQPVMVPRWVRGAKEYAFIESEPGKTTTVNICALGGSVATPALGIKANVVEVHNFEELAALGKENIELKHRIGDYILIPKKNYVY